MSGEIRFPIVGNLTADPELRYTQSGLAVVDFTIASTPRESDGNGGQKDGEPVFMRCSAWREFAEHIAGSLTKGTRVIAYGRYRQRRYQTENQENRTSHEFEVEAIGPELRWATAAVTKVSSGSTRQSAPAAEAWFPTPSDQPSPYSDETPF